MIDKIANGPGALVLATHNVESGKEFSLLIFKKLQYNALFVWHIISNLRF